uniref:Splicing factor YJU2 n=2 Tax=Auxenochlorella protothecoides TaxID=3075 RepID=A0A1D1ZVQ7_AUXPR
MGERKVLNKYFPPDFDPAKLPKASRVRSEDKQMKVRMMLPMSVRCNTCGTYMYKGTKFNCRMEDVRGESYLGIKIFRFYYRCTACSAEFCMKTDPKNTDYTVEGGATRNYEPWRDKEKAKLQTAAEREEEERGNAMKVLENRTLDSKREMDLTAALDEMQSLKARHARVDTEAALAALSRAREGEGEEPPDLDEEDEAAVRAMLLHRAGFVRRLSDSEEEGSPVGPGPEGGGGGGGAARPHAPRLSVAAAAWDEEEDGEEPAPGGKGDQIDAPSSSKSGSEPAGERANGAGEAAGLDDYQAPAAAPAAAKPKAPPVNEPATVMPRFAVKPAAIVVKRKAPEPDGEPAVPEDVGLQSLLGGYDSSDHYESQ